MSYTVGIKRRFWFGYRKIKVNAHDWQNWRFILNLEDGSQEHIPGFHLDSLKVYADFWNHLAKIEHDKLASAIREASRETPVIHKPSPVVAPVVKEVEAPFIAPKPENGFMFDEALRQGPVEPAPETPEMLEVRRRASERVRDILANGGPH